MFLYYKKQSQPKCRCRKYDKGMTLIELMVVVALIAIITTFALPAYNNYVMRADRAQAEAILLENAQAIQTYYNLKNTYAGASLSSSQSPASGAAKYSISLLSPTVSAFSLAAVPINDDPECGTLTLSSTGVKGSSGSRDVAYCWR